jgi:hypothetical protein
MSKINLIIEFQPDDTQSRQALFSMSTNSGQSNEVSDIKRPDLNDIEFDAAFGIVPLPAPDNESPQSFAFGAASDLGEEPDISTVIMRGSVDDERLEAFEASAEKSGVRVYADPTISSLSWGISHPSGPIGSVRSVRAKLNISDFEQDGLDGRGVAIAIMDTGINLTHLRHAGVYAKLDPSLTWTPGPNLPFPGQWPVGHGTMCAYDALISAQNATLLDFPILQSTRQGGSAMDGLLSDAIAAYSVLLIEMSKPSNHRAYSAIVVNNSWGMYNFSWDFPKGHSGRYGDNPNHPFHRQVENLSKAGADILFAAGNCGSSCADGRCFNPVTRRWETNKVNGANSHPSVLSIGGVDINDDRLCYSSEGPGFIGKEKPDVCSYTHFLGSRAYGANAPDSGTSAACPVAAGIIAALRTRYDPVRVTPSDLNDAVRDSARNNYSLQTWKQGFGYGIMDPALILNALQNSNATVYT